MHGTRRNRARLASAYPSCAQTVHVIHARSSVWRCFCVAATGSVRGDDCAWCTVGDAGLLRTSLFLLMRWPMRLVVILSAAAETPRPVCLPLSWHVYHLCTLHFLRTPVLYLTTRPPLHRLARAVPSPAVVCCASGIQPKQQAKKFGREELLSRPTLQLQHLTHRIDKPAVPDRPRLAGRAREKLSHSLRVHHPPLPGNWPGVGRIRTFFVLPNASRFDGFCNDLTKSFSPYTPRAARDQETSHISSSQHDRLAR